MKYQISINKMVTEDLYEEGEVGMTQDHGEIIKLHEDKLENVPLTVAQFLGCDVGELYVYDDARIEFGGHDRDDGYRATEQDKALWKEGKMRLWSASYQAYVTEVTSKEVSKEKLKSLGMKGY